MATRTGYEHGQFCWVDLMARDLAASKEFYGGLFGWTAEDQDTRGGPPYAIFQIDGAGVCGGGEMNEEMKASGMPPMWNSYINVDDIHAACERAAQLGAQITMPPLRVLDAGWLAFFQDPTGGHVGLWQKINHFGAGKVSEPGCFCWNELATRDAEGAREFYAALLGWDFADNPEAPTKYYLVKNGGKDNGGILQMDEKWGETPPHWMVYFTVANADESARKVEELGGRLCAPAFDIPVGRMTVLGDPHGAVFSAIQLKAPPTE